MIRVLGRSKNRDTQGDGHVTAEAGVMCLQAKDSWKHQMLERHRAGSPWSLQREPAMPTPGLRLLASRPRENTFLWF